MVEVFERCAEEAPWGDAVRFVEHGARSCVSYGQLDRLANAVAWHLIRRYGSRPEPVALAVCAPHLMLASALGVLKAGKFYAAVNPLQPAARVRSTFEQLGARIALFDSGGATAAGRATATGSAGRAVPGRAAGLPRSHAVEEILAAATSQGGPSEERPGLRFEAGRLAYVLYTSGSTGRPRGIAQCRGDMLHNVVRHRALHVMPDDCVSLVNADGFVSSISNPYIALLNGAALAPCSFRNSGVDGMTKWLREAQVTVLYAFPSLLRQLDAAEDASEWNGMRLVYLGGEPVLPADLSAARRLFPAATLSTGLNSTETGLTCLHMIPPGSELPDPVPVGRPVPDVEVAIVGEHGASLPAGQAGEIEIRSKHVRPRHWKALRPLDEPEGAHGFRTGDRGRVDSRGIVYHLGRADRMVKVRGFRVEPAEVETAIAALDAVAEVAVIAAGDRSGGAELVAYVVGREVRPGERPAASIRKAVAQALPAAMIPARVTRLDALPRTPNGKVDRGALARLAMRFHARPRSQAVAPQDPSPANVRHPSPANVRHPSAVRVRRPGPVRLARQAVPKRGVVERQVAAIWAAVLGVEDVRAGEDFFALGGTSIAAVSVIARVRAELGVRVPLAVLFQTPSVAALVDAVIEEDARVSTAPPAWPPGTAVRFAREADFAGVCELVNHYIRSTTYNFRTELQTHGEWTEQWAATRDRYPWLVAACGGRILGIAYAGSWKQRAAYDWCAEVTAYVAPEARRTGVGRALYGRLLALLDRQGYRTQVAAIALPNEPSVAFHEACGFGLAGVLGRVGFKHGRWLDVGFWQRSAPDAEGLPLTPVLDVQEAGRSPWVSGPGTPEAGHLPPASNPGTPEAGDGR